MRATVAADIMALPSLAVPGTMISGLKRSRLRLTGWHRGMMTGGYGSAGWEWYDMDM